MVFSRSMSTVAVLVTLLVVFVSIAAAQGGVRYDLRKGPKCTTKFQKRSFKDAAKAGNGERTSICISSAVVICVRAHAFCVA